MLISVQSPIGTKRIEFHGTDSASSFVKKIRKTFELDETMSIELYRKQNRIDQIPSQEGKNMASFKVKHGDTLYVVFKRSHSDVLTDPPSASISNYSRQVSRGSFSNSSSNSSSSSSASYVPSSVVEDEVDVILYKQDGYIQKERDPKLCQHGTHGKCVHCVPIEPYNEEYLKEQNIKHLSFHSYLRKLTGGADKGKFVALENVSCKIKEGCKEHLPWPKGICTKCQPNAVTLNRQPYRHVDNVVFENPFLVERFLNYWRCTGHQRIGLLYGRYEIHKDVPLGVKATVAAIYEPPQDGSRDFLRLLPDERKDLVDNIAKKLGLTKVGWIFTDLIAEDLQKGTVKHLRNASSYFLSAQECIMAGHFQTENPNACRLSPDGYFGSKFVTVCVTGDIDNHVHMEGYQVSNQCMALVRDKCLVPTLDAPQLGYVRESTNEQYVPDVFYKDKDSYGNEILRLARPLPIEYLLVDVPASTPVEPQFTFYADATIDPFPVENRLIDDQVQGFRHLASYLRQFQFNNFLDAMSDFHLLLYIATMDMLPLEDALDMLLEAVKTKNEDLARRWSHNEHWATVEHLIEAEASSMPPAQPQRTDSNATDASNAMWTCRHCTFLNQPDNASCEMCSLPK